MTTPQPQGLPPQTFAEWLAQPVDWDVMGNPITRSMTLHGAYMSAAEYGWNAATEALRAHLEQSSQHPAPSPAQAVDAVGEQNSFERARERGTFSPPLDYCPTWYATELRMEGWRARAALQASHQPQPQVQQGGGESTATKLAKRTCEANAEAARFTIALQTLRASLDPDDWMGPVTMHAYIDKVLAGGSPLNPDCTLTAKEPK